MSVFLVILLVISKLYYINIFSIGVYNFTLSDVCLIICFIQIILPIGKRYYRDSGVLTDIKKLILISVGIALLNCVTTILIGSVLTSTIMNFVKRWLSIIIIPTYIYKCVPPNKRQRLTALIIVVISIYTLLNLRGIISADATRYTAEDTANPNIIAGLFGLLLVYTINLEYKIPTKVFIILLSAFMILACSSRGGIIAVLITALYLISISDIKVSQKIGIVVGFVAIVVVGLVFGSIFLPSATERIVQSFVGGLSETESFKSRMGILGNLFSAMFRNVELLFLGTGYGNGNMQKVFTRYGSLITTADNMYCNLFAWCGLFGVPFVIMFFLKLINISGKSSKTVSDSKMPMTIFMLALGFTQDSLFEPTVGCLYYILLGLELIRSYDSKPLNVR